MTERLLLTGAAGFIGRNCMDVLADAHWEVHAVDRQVTEAGAAGVYWHEIDLLESREIVDLLVEVRPTHLLHLAWTGARPVYRSLENFRWVSESLRLFQEFAACGGRRIVALGSSAEYRWGDWDCVEGETEIFGETIYGVCKSALGRLFTELCRESGVSGAWARPFFLYGPYESSSRLVASVITSLLRGEEARCTHGRQIRDYLYAGDAAAALVHLLRSDFEGVVNVGSGQGVSLAEIVGFIARTLERDDLVRLGAIEASEGEAERVVADVRRLSGQVGWEPSFSLERGLEATIDWWRRSPASPSNGKAGE